jgi:hypothetical protein
VLTAVFSHLLRVQSLVVLWAIAEKSSVRWLDSQQQASWRGLTAGACWQQEHLQQVAAVVVAHPFLQQRPFARICPYPTIMGLHSSKGSA